MVELFGIYALLLAGWGLWRQRRTGAADERTAAAALAPIAPAVAAPVSERGSAARRHLSTLS